MKRNLGLRKFTVGILQTVIGAAVLLSSASVRADPPGTGWTQVFSDDFNGTTLDTNKWNTCHWWGPNGCTISGNKELEWYQPDDVLVQDGTLSLRAQQRSMNGFNYTSGMIASHDKYSFKYGYTEIRAKMPNGQGLWPAFWLAAQDRTWPPEIDILEILGHETNRVHMTVHYGQDWPNNLSSTGSWVAPDFSADYHTFAVQWSPERIIWYVDGVERKRYETAANIPAKPMYILANLAVGGTWPGSPNATTPFPSYYDIDYIKVWRSDSTPPTATATPITTETESLTVAAKSRDRHKTFDDANLSGRVGTILEANAANDYVTYTVNVPEARTFNVKVKVKKSNSAGNFQLSVDGINYSSTQDLYAASESYVELDLGDITFNSSGNKLFKFTVTGRNASSKGNKLAFDYIKLMPR